MSEEITNIDDLLNSDDFSVEITDLSKLEPLDDSEFPPLKDEPVDIAEEEDDLKEEDTPAPADEEEVEEVDEDDIHSTFETVAKGLAKLGKFGDIPEGTKLTQDKFLELYDNFTKEQAYSQVEEMITSRHGDEGMKVFKDIFMKGVTPKEYLSSYQKQIDFENIELEDNIYNQKNVVRQYLSSIDWEDSDIEEHIDTLIESKKLEGMATSYKTKLVKKQQQEREVLVRESENRLKLEKQMKQQRIADISGVLNEAVAQKSINGIPITLEDTKVLLDYMTSDAYRLPNGQVITEFDKDYLELKKDPIKFAALAKLVKEGLNVTKIKEKGVDELEEKAFDFRTKKKVKTNPADAYSFLDKFLK